MRAEEKRTRLTEAAKLLIYQQGFHRTTLADVAEASGVPLGNVYYHFKTKEALVEAVIAAHLQDIQQYLTLWEGDPDPRERLKAFARSGRAFSDRLVLYGCPYATLCQELEKDESHLGEVSASLFRLYLKWCEEQFRLLGKDEEAADLAIDLVSSIQGAYELTHSLRSPELLNRKIERLETWLETLV